MLNLDKYPIENKSFIKPFKFYQDAGHGWLAVPIDIINWLGIKGDISNCSYIDEINIYLEEDCDASVFDQAIKSRGISYKTETVYHDNSPIRNKSRTI